MDDDYLSSSGVDRMIQALVQQLRVERPAKPAEFMVKFLQDNYIKKDIKKRSSYDCYEEDQMEEDPPQEDRTYFVVPESFKRKRRGIIQMQPCGLFFFFF